MIAQCLKIQSENSITRTRQRKSAVNDKMLQINVKIPLCLATAVHSRLDVQGRRPLCSTADSIKVQKSLLSKLRRETGFPFSKCSAALQRHRNDYDAAVDWLHEQAEKEGWNKATKLQGRSTSQGLVGLRVEDNFAAMVEVRHGVAFLSYGNCIGIFSDWNTTPPIWYFLFAK